MTYPLPGANWTALRALRTVALTSVSFPLQDATPTIASWEIPADGKPHPVIVVASQDVTAAETGGKVELSYTLPGGSTRTDTLFGGGSGIGTTDNIVGGVAAAGTTVTVSQASALTAGTADVDVIILGL